MCKCTVRTAQSALASRLKVRGQSGALNHVFISMFLKHVRRRKLSTCTTLHWFAQREASILLAVSYTTPASPDSLTYFTQINDVVSKVHTKEADPALRRCIPMLQLLWYILLRYILLLHIRLMRRASTKRVTAFTWARVVHRFWRFEHSSVEGATASGWRVCRG